MQYVLKRADGAYYSFCDSENYDLPQFSHDIRDAKVFTIRGARNVKGRLKNPKWYGQDFEIVLVE